MERHSYQPNTKFLNTNRPEGLSTNVNHFNFIKNLRENLFATINRLYQILKSLQQV